MILVARVDVAIYVHATARWMQLVSQYNSKGEVDKRLQMQPGKSGGAGSSSSSTGSSQ